jgi:hypothetical protein
VELTVGSRGEGIRKERPVTRDKILIIIIIIIIEPVKNTVSSHQ